MKLHTVYGQSALSAAEETLGSNSFLRLAKEIAYTHQEKWDGSGYPQGLKGEEIPVSGRLMAIADVYDALISKRVNKPAFSHEKAMDIIRQGRGSHFDPDIVDAFLDLEDQIKGIAETNTD
jgi:putative two-component system response regulator